MSRQITVGDLREEIIAETTDVGITDPDPVPVTVWCGQREHYITNVIFDDGEITILIEEKR